MEKVSLSRNDLLGFAADDLGFYGLDVTRISTVCIAQIYQLQRKRIVDTYCIMDEIKYLIAPKQQTPKRETHQNDPKTRRTWIPDKGCRG